MKQYVIVLILSIWGGFAIAQKQITQRFEVAKSDNISLRFDEANVVRVEGWDQAHIEIVADVSINDGTQDEAYKIEGEKNGNTFQINGLLKDKSELPQVIRIKKGDQVYTFHTDDWDSPEIKQFYEEHGREGISWKSHGISWDVHITIKVPNKSTLNVTSRHGVVELVGLSGNVEANSTHGGIDLTIDRAMRGTLSAKTRWGNIYSNVDLDIDPSSSNRDWNHVVASVNGGSSASFELESKHANIYLRKDQ